MICVRVRLDRQKGTGGGAERDAEEFGQGEEAAEEDIEDGDCSAQQQAAVYCPVEVLLRNAGKYFANIEPHIW